MILRDLLFYIMRILNSKGFEKISSHYFQSLALFLKSIHWRISAASKTWMSISCTIVLKLPRKWDLKCSLVLVKGSWSACLPSYTMEQWVSICLMGSTEALRTAQINAFQNISELTYSSIHSKPHPKTHHSIIRCTEHSANVLQS